MRFPLYLLPFAAGIVLPSFSLAAELTCSDPIQKGDSAESLTQRFGEDAVIVDLPGAEGETQQGVQLFPNDPDKRLNVYFFDEAMQELATVQPDDGVTGWSVDGLSIGDDFQTLLEANGGPFEISGFDWDYGGYVTDFLDGKLSTLDGGCGLSVRFSPDPDTEVPMELSGDQVISSSNETLVTLNPKVGSIALLWGEP
ncbi:hypothetical protein [Rhizobium sp. L1K21]|uniref:hypothetical protein n=1 Tax=Rhizobium sp. L1K21 TaxID=2954933 RepID=UPI0020937CF2|nr:hypothetical protein [Rhizobium sp. L1K21]MCO6186915.1 hypothetical protein [Rhizobium sp. L1K21]